jgi:hypothetical protein
MFRNASHASQSGVSKMGQRAEHQAKREIARKIALEEGALEQCEFHQFDFDPVDDDALDRARERARTMIEAKDPLVDAFGGDADELVEMVDDVVGNAAEECPSCESPDEE